MLVCNICGKVYGCITGYEKEPRICVTSCSRSKCFYYKNFKNIKDMLQVDDTNICPQCEVET